jgi:hypothetical protein
MQTSSWCTDITQVKVVVHSVSLGPQWIKAASYLYSYLVLSFELVNKFSVTVNPEDSPP